MALQKQSSPGKSRAYWMFLWSYCMRMCLTIRCLRVAVATSGQHLMLVGLAVPLVRMDLKRTVSCCVLLVKKGKFRQCPDLILTDAVWNSCAWVIKALISEISFFIALEFMQTKLRQTKRVFASETFYLWLLRFTNARRSSWLIYFLGLLNLYCFRWVERRQESWGQGS